MNVFIFQALKEKFDLAQGLIPGQSETWLLSKYQKLIKDGDAVFFWQGGDVSYRGLYGWGKIISEPYKKASWGSHGIDVKYLVKFREPILASLLKITPVLDHLLILRNAVGTNFLMEPSEVKKLLHLLREKGEKTPDHV